MNKELSLALNVLKPDINSFEKHMKPDINTINENSVDPDQKPADQDSHGFLQITQNEIQNCIHFLYT